MTLNLWGTRGDWEARRAVVTRRFAELAPDLITLQETILTADHDQAREILGDGYHLVQQTAREPDGQGITTASRWPITRTLELNLHVSPRSDGFACSCLITEIAAPAGRIWLANHLPDWQLDHEHERCLQAVVAATEIERLRAEAPGHVIVAGDFDADPAAASVRFWTGRQPLQDVSVCYRDAWESVHAGAPGPTFVPENPFSADWDWPFRRIDYVLVRCGEHGGPTLRIEGCRRIFDGPPDTVSDHYGLLVDLA